MKIALGCHVVEVLSDKATTAQLLREGKFGDSDVEQLKIRVRGDLPPSVFRETLVHEALHHVLALTAWVEKLSEDQQEDLIRSISPYVAQLGLFLECSGGGR